MGVDEQLSDRKGAILQAVVEEYVATARPVGSGLVAEQSDLQVSSATVRKELSALEEEGFLHQPHTSAGRVPTDKGYRYFVDTLMAPQKLDESAHDRISEFFARSHGELERILRDTSRLLAGVTDYAAVVIAPSPDVATPRAVQLVALSDQLVLIVVVLSNGGIERRTIELTESMSDTQVLAAQDAVRAVLIDGQPLSPSGDPMVDELAARTITAWDEDTTIDTKVHVGGRSAVADAFDQTQTVAQVLQLFERQLLVVSLIRDVLDRGLRVAIGSETGVQNLNDCSIVVSPYEIEGEEAGTIGVLGPTNMNYPRALAAVAVISNQLGDHLTRG